MWLEILKCQFRREDPFYFIFPDCEVARTMDYSFPQIAFHKSDHCAAFWLESDDTPPENCPVCLQRPKRSETTVLACGHPLCNSCFIEMLTVPRNENVASNRRHYSRYCYTELEGDSMRTGFPDHFEMAVPCDEGDKYEYLQCGLLLPTPKVKSPWHFCLRCPLCRRWAKPFPAPSYHGRLTKTTRQLWEKQFPSKTL